MKPDMDEIEVIRSVPDLLLLEKLKNLLKPFDTIGDLCLASFLKKKYVSNWIQCQCSFEALKEQMTAVTLLVYPNLSKPMTLYTDESNSCIGAFSLSQIWQIYEDNPSSHQYNCPFCNIVISETIRESLILRKKEQN